MYPIEFNIDTVSFPKVGGGSFGAMMLSSTLKPILGTKNFLLRLLMYTLFQSFLAKNCSSETASGIVRILPDGTS